MTTLTAKSPNLNWLWALGDIGIVWIVAMVFLEFQHQYLHNPAVHIFFQSQGVFLF